MTLSQDLEPFGNRTTGMIWSREGVSRAKASACDCYDLWGVAPPDQPQHAWQQISQFKRKFGGVEVQLVRTLDHIYDAAAYEHFQAAEGRRDHDPAATDSGGDSEQLLQAC